jgi:dCMP deaminase
MGKAETDILYIPALHSGYIEYLKKRNGSVNILGEGLVHEIPRLDRDIRAISAELMKDVVQVVVPERQVFVIRNASNIGRIIDANETVYMPDEDVSHSFAERYLRPIGMEVLFENVFLRWDKKLSTKQTEVDADIAISTNELDRFLIDQTLIEAARSPDWWRQLGCLIVKDGKIILQGHNRPYPTENYTLETFGDPRSNFDAGEHIELQKCVHAEAGLIAQAARNGTALEGSQLVVTTFPCPVCARSIAEAGITRVVYRDGYSLLDAQDIFAAKGIELVRVEPAPTNQSE